MLRGAKCLAFHCPVRKLTLALHSATTRTNLGVLFATRASSAQRTALYDDVLRWSAASLAQYEAAAAASTAPAGARCTVRTASPPSFVISVSLFLALHQPLPCLAASHCCIIIHRWLGPMLRGCCRIWQCQLMALAVPSLLLWSRLLSLTSQTVVTTAPKYMPDHTMISLLVHVSLMSSCVTYVTTERSRASHEGCACVGANCNAACGSFPLCSYHARGNPAARQR